MNGSSSFILNQGTAAMIKYVFWLISLIVLSCEKGLADMNRVVRDDVKLGANSISD